MSVEKRPGLAAERVAMIEAHAARLGLTPFKLLERAGVHASYFSRWRKRSVCPNAETLEKILAVKG